MEIIFYDLLRNVTLRPAPSHLHSVTYLSILIHFKEMYTFLFKHSISISKGAKNFTPRVF